LFAAFIAAYVPMIAQGFTTHALNDLIDARSGADEYKGRPFGGSKVIQAGLLSEKDLVHIFWVSLLISAPVGFIYAFIFNPWLILFMVTGFLSGILYTLPPFKFSYRPFLGEWVSALGGMMSVVLGSYFIQTGTLSLLIIMAALLFSFSCMNIMLLFHTMDYENDKTAVPKKNTTIVYLGRDKAKLHILILASLCIIGWSFIAFEVSGVFFPLVIFAIVSLYFYSEYDVNNNTNVMITTKSITWLNIGGVFITATIIHPFFFIASLPVLLGYWGYKKAGKLNADEKSNVYRELI
jgi:1,4-dihydroxy-2-naphthoate octaprenyltransferase